MTALKIVSRPKLKRPVLIMAFQGWNDGGQGATRKVHEITERGRAALAVALGAERAVTVADRQLRQLPRGREPVGDDGGRQYAGCFPALSA